MGRISLLNQSVAFEHKINKSNAKVSANYRMCLHFEGICYDIFIDNRFSDFFLSFFNTIAIKVCCVIAIYIQSYPVSSH